MSEFSELNKIAKLYNIQADKLSCNPLYETDERRHVNSLAQLRRCYKYRPQDRYHIIKGVWYKHEDEEMLLEIYKYPCDCFQCATTIAGRFSQQFMNTIPKATTVQFDNADDILDIIKADRYHSIALRKHHFSSDDVKKIVDCIDEKKIKDDPKILIALLGNKHIDINPIIERFNIKQELDATDFHTIRASYFLRKSLDSILLHPSVDLSEYTRYAKYSNDQMYDIYPFLQSPNLTDELFIKHVGNITITPTILEELFANGYEMMYKTLSLDVLLNYCKPVLNPQLLLKHKKYDLPHDELSDEQKAIYRYWYRYPEFRKQFNKRRCAWRNSIYIKFIILHCKLIPEIIRDLWFVDYSSCYKYFHKNKHINTKYMKSIIKEDDGLLRRIYWYLSYNIPINDVLELISKYNGHINFSRLCQRRDFPINRLLSILIRNNLKISSKICKNIYLTAEIMLKYGIRPNVHYLKHNMFHLDPLYIKPHSYSIEL